MNNIKFFTLVIVGVLFGTAFTSAFNAANAQAVYELKLSAPPLLQKGRELLREGDSLQAQKVYKQALKNKLTEIQTAKAHNGLCVAFIMEEVWQSALEHCNKAIQIYPSNWRFYNNRGNIFLETGMLKKAISEYEKGLKHSPSSDIIKNNLKLAQTRLNGQTPSGNLEKTKRTTNI
jgi:tetratricopeptide (TPR) repeat protein